MLPRDAVAQRGRARARARACRQDRHAASGARLADAAQGLEGDRASLRSADGGRDGADPAWPMRRGCRPARSLSGSRARRAPGPRDERPAATARAATSAPPPAGRARPAGCCRRAATSARLRNASGETPTLRPFPRHRRLCRREARHQAQEPARNADAADPREPRADRDRARSRRSARPAGRTCAQARSLDRHALDGAGGARRRREAARRSRPRIERDTLFRETREHPDVQAILKRFPGRRDRRCARLRSRAPAPDAHS